MTEIVIDTRLGPIKGLKRYNVLDQSKEFYCFQGIPYAEPPVGDLRFKSPQPLSSTWEGTLDATKDGTSNMCAQLDMMITMGPCGSDDCLYLNVYTPEPKLESNKPVMVFIHGGGFTFGHSSYLFYGPDFLLNTDIVLVTINYRLNILGFLNLGLEECPGNTGLKDQIAALRWIKQNIEIFGGDKNNITLFGESAGSASTHYLMMASPARGLFHKAILQSGCALDSWAFQTQEESVENALCLAKHLGCGSNDLKTVLTFFKSLPALELVKSQSEVIVTAEKIRKTLVFPFVPSVEIAGPLQERVVTNVPIVMLKQNIPVVPFITGINSQESLLLFRMSGPEKISNILSKVETDFERVVPINFNADETKEKMIATEIKKYFFKDNPVSYDTVDQYLNLYTDLMFSLGFYQFLSWYTQTDTVNGFVYLLSYEGGLNRFKNLFINTYIQIPGVAHADDLGYLFYSPMIQQTPEPGSNDEKTCENMCTLWSNFAKTGVPSTNNFTSWKPCRKNEIQYLIIDSELSMKGGFVFNDRYEFWKKLYSTYQSNFLKEKL